MSSPTPIAVIGSGLIGLRHIDHCLSEPQVTLACIVEPGPAGGPLAAKHNVPLFASVGDMLAARAKGDLEVTGAIVATPNHTHVPLVRQLIEAGAHALVEKPISTDVASGRELVAAVAAGEGKVLVGHHRRFNPYIVSLAFSTLLCRLVSCKQADPFALDRFPQVNTKTLLDRSAVGKGERPSPASNSSLGIWTLTLAPLIKSWRSRAFGPASNLPPTSRHPPPGAPKPPRVGPS